MLLQMILGLSIIVAVQDAPPARAVDIEARAKAVAPFLDEQTVAIARFDVTRVNFDALADAVTRLGITTNFQMEAGKFLLKQQSGAFLKAGGKDVYIVVSVADVPATNPFVVVPLAPNADAKALTQMLKLGINSWESVDAMGPALVRGDKRTLERLRKSKPAARPDVAEAFAAAGDMTAQVIFAPTAEMRRVVEEMLPHAPHLPPAYPMTIFTRGALWIAFGIEAPPNLALRAVIQSQDAESARTFRDTIANLAKLAPQDPGVREALPQIDQLGLDKLLNMQAVGNQVRWAVDDKQFAAVLAALGPKVRQADAAQHSMNNFKQIGIAFHTYHDGHKEFPTAASYDKNGKPLLSWRVYLLPYLEQEQLFKEFHLDEPWDSEHNKKLIAKMPDVYAGAGMKKEDGKTTYLAPLGEATMFPGKTAMQFKDVSDGTSNTIFIVEAAADRAVTWTKPDDLTIDPKEPANGLTKAYEGKFLVLFVDGSVRMLPAKIDAKTLYALFTRNGGEVVQIP